MQRMSVFTLRGFSVSTSAKYDVVTGKEGQAVLAKK